MAFNYDNRYPGYTDVYAANGNQLSDYLRTVVRGWRTILVVTLIVLLAGGTYAFLTPPTYRADVMFHVDDRSGGAESNAGAGGGGRNSLTQLTGMFDTRPSTTAEIELLKSRLVTEDTVQKLHLDITAAPHYFPVIGQAVAGVVNGQWGFRLPSFIDLSHFAAGHPSIAVSRFDTVKEMYGVTFTLVAQDNGAYLLRDRNGNAVLSGRVGETVQANTADGPITLHVDALTGKPGQHFDLSRASTIGTVDRLQKALVVQEIGHQSGVVRASLESGDSALGAAIVNSIAREFVRQDMDSRTTAGAHMLAYLDEQLPAARKQLDDAEQRYNTFRNAHGTVNLGEESKLLLQQSVDNQTKLLALQQQRAQLLTRFTPSHPMVAEVDAQIAALQKAQGAMNRSVSVMPDTEQASVQMQRDVRVASDQYTALLNNAQQLRMAKAGDVGSVRVVDYAQPNDDPIRPNRLLIVLGSLGGGIVLGVLCTFAKRALFGGVERSDQLEGQLGLPVFAVVPRSQTQLRLQSQVSLRRHGQHVLANQAPSDMAVEGIRNLRTSLTTSLDHATNNVVMITGSRPDAGKSFLSVNLSALVASAEKRVLIIDGDMRRGDVHSHFGIPHQPGLSDVLQGGDLHAMIQRDVLPGLDVLAKGSLPTHPAELLMSKRFEVLLDTLKPLYDLVIVDTPPVLAVTDSTVIGKYAGTTLLVVRHGKQPLSEIIETAKRLRNGGVAMRGVLLTDVPQEAAFPGSGYQGGNYGYESIAG